MATFEDVTDAGPEGEGVTRALVEEMLPFLRDPRPEIRQAAAKTAVAVSASKEGVTLLHECGAVKWLCRISGDVGTIAKDSVSALVNASAEETMTAALEDMCKAGIVNRMMESASAEDCAPNVRDLCLQLLANVTRVQLGAEKLAQAGGPREGQHVHNLTKWLTAHPAAEGLPYPALLGESRDNARVVDRRAATRDATDEYGGREAGSTAVLDQWQHCASILCNAARIPEGRRSLRKPAPRVALAELLSQLSSANPLRRWGVAGCIRNCCFEEEDHPWLLNDLKVVPALLMRLSDDQDEYDFDEKVVLDPRVWRREDGASPKRREPVQIIKRDIVEALLQLCATVDSRQMLRKMGVYYVIRELDKSEPDGEISQVCYNLVNFLQRDEQDKQERIDYLKGLAEREGVADAANGDKVARATGAEVADTEIDAMQEVSPSSADGARRGLDVLATQGAPGSTAERTAYLRDQLKADGAGAVAANRSVDNSRGPGLEEEFVGDEGADAMKDMLAAFDD